MGPRLPHSEQVHAEKYRAEGETFTDAMWRLAKGLNETSFHRDRFAEILLDMRFMPAGRVQAAIGSPKNITPYNCFVSGTIHDSFVHGSGNAEDSIMDIGKKAATTMRMGGGIGYNFSTLRPSNDLIKGVLSRTDGPLAFMPIYDAVCKATSSAGNRRGAQMGVLNISHPDIERFITIKQPPAAVRALWDHVEALPASEERGVLVDALQKTLPLTGFNLSIGITDKFMACLASSTPFPLEFGGRVYKHVDPEALWETVMRSTWDWAEPGVLFIDTINKMNNLYYCEEITATNPCGEQPLPPHGACLLGSQNLVKYVRRFGDYFSFDWDQFREDIPFIVRSMDRVVDISSFPLEEQQQEAWSKRRMGIGITGLANAAEALGMPYGGLDFLNFERQILQEQGNCLYQASMELARELSPFPLFDETLYPRSEFLTKAIDPAIVSDIRKNGIRNSHLSSIAPTGTISYTADNISSGLEPVFMLEGLRKMKTKAGDVIVNVEDYGLREFGVRGKTADKVTAQEHVDVLATASNLVDSAVSKTCNVSPDMPWDDFKGIYVQAHQRGCKGATTFNPGGKRMGIFIAKEPEKEEAEACTFDPATGRRNCE